MIEWYLDLPAWVHALTIAAGVVAFIVFEVHASLPHHIDDDD